LCARWKALAAARLKILTAPFAVLLAPVLSEPHQYGPGVDRASLASLDPEAPVQRLAFVLDIEEGRVAFFEQGASGRAILPLAEFESHCAGIPPYLYRPCNASLPRALTIAPHQERIHDLVFRRNQPVPKQSGHRDLPCNPVTPHASHAIQACGSEIHVMRPLQTRPLASTS